MSAPNSFLPIIFPYDGRLDGFDAEDGTWILPGVNYAQRLAFAIGAFAGSTLITTWAQAQLLTIRTNGIPGYNRFPTTVYTTIPSLDFSKHTNSQYLGLAA